jgi:riboflavin synthase
VFTGLVQDRGRILAVDRDDAGARLRIATRLAPEIATGDSVSVSGVCLTATEVTEDSFAADVMNQTLQMTALGALEEGAAVNLEPALRASDRLGGHIVQGHVDGVGEVVEVTEDGFARWIAIRLPEALRRYVVEHGSIGLEGVSLTVARLRPDGVEVSLIPETLERTTLGDLDAGSPVNVEIDVVARYAERLLQGFGPMAPDETHPTPETDGS